MPYEVEEYKCESKRFRVAKYVSKPSDALFKRVLTKSAPDLAGKVNVNDPSGVRREERKRIVKCFAGVLAEELISDFLTRRLEESGDEDELEVVMPKADYSIGQIDMRVRSKVDHALSRTIEVRSSYSCIARTMEDVITHSMSLLGPYSTSTKPGEVSKDFFLTCIHRIDREYIQRTTGKRIIEPGSPEVTDAVYQHLCERGLTSFFVGGDDENTFTKSPKVMKDDLYQAGAEYRVIRPICNGRDAIEMANLIFKSLS